MNCDNLTREQAVALFYKSLPLKGYGQQILEYLSLREQVWWSMDKSRIGDVIYGSDGISVKGDFRGFLFGTSNKEMVEAGDEVKKGIPFKRFHFTKGLGMSHVIYIGDEINIYWSDNTGGTPEFRPTAITNWNSFNRDVSDEPPRFGGGGYRLHETGWNKFGVGGMLDVTDLICGRGDTLIKWNNLPWGDAK